MLAPVCAARWTVGIPESRVVVERASKWTRTRRRASSPNDSSHGRRIDAEGRTEEAPSPHLPLKREYLPLPPAVSRSCLNDAPKDHRPGSLAKLFLAYLHSGSPRSFCTSSLVAAKFFDALRGRFDDGLRLKSSGPDERINRGHS